MANLNDETMEERDIETSTHISEEEVDPNASGDVPEEILNLARRMLGTTPQLIQLTL